MIVEVCLNENGYSVDTLADNQGDIIGTVLLPGIIQSIQAR